MQSDEIDYQIIGQSMQLVEIELDPGESVIAQSGAMSYMEADIQFEARMGDGSEPDQGVWGKLKSAGKRAISGATIFMTHFTNTGSQKRRIGFAASFPGHVLPLDLAEIGGEVLCQKGAFLCAAMGTKLDIAFTKRFGTGFLGGEGFVLQKIKGDGKAFLQAGGALIPMQLNNETLRVDTGCLVGFTPGIDYSIESAGGVKNMMFGGEGVFLATLRGSGIVWVQSLPFSQLIKNIARHLPSKGD